MKLRKGDTVKVIAGGNSKKNNDKGKIGEILKVNAKDNTVVVEGVNTINSPALRWLAASRARLPAADDAVRQANASSSTDSHCSKVDCS